MVAGRKFGKGGEVMPEEARAKIRGARSCYAAWGGRAKTLEIFFQGKEWHGHAKGHDQVVPNFWLAKVSVSAFCGVFGLCFGWGLCLGYFRGPLWTKRAILWRNQMWVFRILD